MKVIELIKKLQGADPDARVYLSSWEESNDANAVLKSGESPYCKGDIPEMFDKCDNFIYITDGY